MKVLIIIILAFGIISDFSQARGISGEMGVCRELEIELSFRLKQEQKGLPDSWDDFIGVVAVKKGQLELESFRVKAINSFALVPGAPVIQTQKGIPREYQGYRLVLISREENITERAGTGRCALFADPGGQNSKQFPVYSAFIPEETAKLILSQIRGYDPKTQPVAFDDEFIFHNRKRIRGAYLDDKIRRLEASRGTPVDESAEAAPIRASKRKHEVLQRQGSPSVMIGRIVEKRWPWIVGGAMLVLLALLAWIMTRMRSRS